jgi:hypothetical protein
VSFQQVVGQSGGIGSEAEAALVDTPVETISLALGNAQEEVGGLSIRGGHGVEVERKVCCVVDVCGELDSGGAHNLLKM